jgi:DNA topoisomerase-1
MSDEDLQLELKKHRLRYISDSIPGFTREKKGKDFVYRDTDGKLVNKETHDRLELLSIPPAWTDVWISPKQNGHIQATGRDEKRRKQYIYHEEWNKIRQENKFEKMIFFGDVLPTLRAEIEGALKEKILSPRKVLATVVWLLGNTYIRVGNQEYAKENQSYGLTTLREKHTEIIGNTVHFEFTGKSGIEHSVEVTHPQVVRTIRQLEDIPGYELFKYTKDGEKHVVTSEEVNDFLQSITGEEITAKDFRTWGGTVLAGDKLYETGPFTSKTQAQKNITSAVKEVAKHLRNTPTVSRSYYIHPYIPESYNGNILIPHFEGYYKRKDLKTDYFSLDEYAVHELLKQAKD